MSFRFNPFTESLDIVANGLTETEADLLYLKLNGSNANVTIDIGSEDLQTTGDLIIDSDSNGLKLGAGQDCTVKHNGTDFTIDNNTGKIFLDSGSNNVKINRNLALKTAIVTGDYSIGGGEAPFTTISGDGCFGLGSFTTISGDNSVSFGSGNTISGQYSFAMGTSHSVGCNKSCSFGTNCDCETNNDDETNIMFGDNIDVINSDFVLCFGKSLECNNKNTVLMFGSNYNAVSASTIHFGISAADFLITADAFKVNADNHKIFLGAGDDCSLVYDGTNMIIDPKEVGSGFLSIPGVSKIGDGGTTNYTEIKTDGEVNLHGTARVKKSIWIGANGVKAPGSKPATFVECGLTGCWQFADAIEANQESISGTLKIPTDMDITVVPMFYIGWHADGISPGNCEWQFEYLWIGANEDTTAAAQETLTVTSTASATSNGLVVAAITGIDLPSVTDKAMLWRITRLSADANDTISDTTEMRGNFFEYTADKLGEAT